MALIKEAMLHEQRFVEPDLEITIRSERKEINDELYHKIRVVRNGGVMELEFDEYSMRKFATLLVNRQT